MLQALANFNPITFLNIDTSSYSDEEIKILKGNLHNKMGEYVLLKMTNYLTPEQTDHILSLSDGNQILNTLNTTVPGLEQKIVTEIENFRKEYQKNG